MWQSHKGTGLTKICFCVQLSIKVHTCDEGQILLIARWKNSHDKISYWNLFIKINTLRELLSFGSAAENLGLLSMRNVCRLWSFSDPGPQQSYCLLNRGAWPKPLGFCPSNSSSGEWSLATSYLGSHYPQIRKALLAGHSKAEVLKRMSMFLDFAVHHKFKCQNPLQKTLCLFLFKGNNNLAFLVLPFSYVSALLT